MSFELVHEYTNDWYLSLNDCYEYNLPTEYILMYLEAIEDIQGGNDY
jgi:hypothetical protein